ncbi:VOC family protein [Roseicyclus sp. F158]|uniref:VOC family protein n=1 Tax=Tropicimonas omnivorans TaxID=3075590 RepID=A0ABU3DL45_9RHOB|nr:VOC family protein [Roseicyclus sp. F158]MDT0684396.1 VOC family protein [Roseicyclus sp. F158]
MSGFPAAEIDHVAVPCRDPEASAAFYVRLGFTRSFAKDGLRQMQLGGAMVELIAAETEMQDAPVPRHVALRVTDARQAAEALDAMGIETDGPPRRGASGALFLFFRDPDGNWIEIVSR